MNFPAKPYLTRARLRVFEYDPGLIRLRRAVRIILCGLFSIVPAGLISAFSAIGVYPRGNAAPLFDPRLILPALIMSVLLAAAIAGASPRARQLGMLRNFLGAVAITIPASLVTEGSLSYGLLLSGAAFLVLYLRRFGPSWNGIAMIGLLALVLVPRLEITPALLPRFWAVLAGAFLAGFFVSFHVLPVRLTRALLDCLARFLAAAAVSGRHLCLTARGRGRDHADMIRKAKREMDESLFLWFSIASGVLPRKDPAWNILDEIADAQFRLGNLLRIARSAIEHLAGPPGEGTLVPAAAVLDELESVLESGRRALVLEGKIPLDLEEFQKEARRFQEDWESRRGPITAGDIQAGRFAVAMLQTGRVLGALSREASQLAGREG
ncbi:MAG: hypothetical protein V1789_00380 [PVC group bacterium]